MLRTFWPQDYRNLRVEGNLPPKLGRVNLLVGPNNSGKSNFIKALGFLPEMLCCESGPTALLHTIEAHGRADVLNRSARAQRQKGSGKKDGDVILHWILDSPSGDSSGQPTDLVYSLGYFVSDSESFPSGFYLGHESIHRYSPQNWWKKKPSSFESRLSVQCHSFSDSGKGRFGRSGLPSLAVKKEPKPRVYVESLIELPVEANETVLRQTKALLKNKDFYERIFPEFDRAAEELMVFARGFRSYSSTELNLRKLVEGAKIDLGVRTLDNEGAEFINVLRYLDQKHDFLDAYAERVRELIPGLKRLKVIDASDVYKQLELHIDGQKYKPREMSDGTLKALWLALLLFSPDKGSVLSIDEPELNMHPAWLKVIGGWFQRFTSAEQLFVSTHSPDLLDTFTEGFKTGDVALFVFGLGDKELRRVEPVELEGFFKEGWELGDLYRVGEPKLGGWPW